MMQWSGIEKTAKESIKERKIRVTFLPAHDPNEGTPGSHHAIVNGDVRKNIGLVFAKTADISRIAS